MREFWSRSDRLLAALILFLLALRLAGIGWGLPALFNGDEPHIVDTAVYFGSGTLRPPIFKYPTCYMYLLALLYGAWFLALKFLGLVSSVADFAALFVWRPTGFYLIGRLVSAFSGVAAAWAVYRTGRVLGSRGMGLWAAALIAVAPVMNAADHAAKPDSLMVLWAALAGLFAVRWIEQGGWKYPALCGAAVGLACATQYTAAPVGLLIPTAFWMSRRNPKALLAALAGAFIAAFVAAPYIFLAFPSFLANFRDLQAQNRITKINSMSPALIVLKNLLFFGGWGVAPFLLWGLFIERKGRALWLPVFAAYLIVLGLQALGTIPRYALGVYPFLALLAGAGFQNLSLRRSWAPWILGLALLPALAECAVFDRGQMLPDTRAEAARWIESHIPTGSTFLMDSFECEPQIPISLEQTEELYHRTLELAHPKSRYYKIMLASHPGGGYRILRIKRTVADIGTQPAHAAWSQEAQALLDVAGGLAVAKEAGVQYLVASSYGVQPAQARYLARYFEDVSRLNPMISFLPKPGRIAGPEIAVYRLQ